MGRPDPCILFAQSFVHSQLDEYVDEVLFNEPVVITACEILEQNVSPSGSMLSLVGATSPPSFALEVFVHCEGESRFRRLCPAFLYSPASSNLLEVEAVITNHLVIRGSYRSLTLVIYGNTAEDLGQFNIEFDLDSSLANLVSSTSEGKLVDLPTAFCSSYLPFEETISSFKLPSSFSIRLDLSNEMKDFVQLILQLCKFSVNESRIFKVVNSVVSAVSPYVGGTTRDLLTCKQHNKHQCTLTEKDPLQLHDALVAARAELAELHCLATNNEAAGSLGAGTTNSECMTSKLLVDMYNQCFSVNEKIGDFLPRDKIAIRLGIAILLCSTSESCYHFVNIGGLRQITNMLGIGIKKSPAMLLTLLVTIEHATRHAIGCEGFLGWWPRDFEDVPIGSSDGYSSLLNLLVKSQRPDVASLATHLLHRLRFYEISSRYESAALYVLRNVLVDGPVMTERSNSLLNVADLLRNIMKLLKFHCFIEDLFGSDLYLRHRFDQADGLLSANDYITYSKHNLATPDIDTTVLFLLKERGFLPLSAALLSSPSLRSDEATMDIFIEIAASIELILLSLLRCRSGLTFLLLQPEATATLVLSLKGFEELNKGECLTLRHASILISKGFFCRPEEISIIVELHLRVVHLIDRLLASTVRSEEQFWILWDLCTLSRSDSGRQALLIVGLFPEVMSVLLQCLRTFADSDVGVANIGHSPSSLVVFHCVAEIFEALVTDSAVSSLSCWMEYAMDLHKALHSSSPGSNRKDAPTRLLEWIDAGVVYNKNGATGLLRYAAVLASGGDAHLSSANVLVSDSIDVENVVGESSSSPDSQIVDSLLGKLVSDKYFDGVTLSTTSLVQLTTAFRILAFISENSVVATSLYEEGAVTLIFVVLVNCKYMLERSSNNYGYLVDEGVECTSTSDLLLERNFDQRLIDLLIPSLLFLINILQKIQDAKEQYKNTKLLNALLKLHREVSPKVIACATQFSLPFTASALCLHAVCRLIVSAVACWPIFGWAPGLFHCLFESVQAAPLLSLGPKDVCSMFCLLGDLLPSEDICLWRNEVPALSALRSVSIQTILDSRYESRIDWYLKPEYQAALFVRLAQQWDKIAEIILTFSSTVLDVLQDILRVLIVRVSCRKAEFAGNLIRPIISWMYSQVGDSSPSEANIFKVFRLMNFISSLMEHPHTQFLLLDEGIVRMLLKLLERSLNLEASNIDGKLIVDSRLHGKHSISVRDWILPALKSLSFMFEFQLPADPSIPNDEIVIKNVGVDVCSSVLRQLLKLCQALPVGRELLGCLLTLKGLICRSKGASARAFLNQVMPVRLQGGVDDSDLIDQSLWIWSPPPFLNCFRKLLRSFEFKDEDSFFALESAHALALISLSLCMDGKSLEGLNILKHLFGVPYKLDADAIIEENLKDVLEVVGLLKQRINSDEFPSFKYKDGTVHKVNESVEALLLQLQSLGGTEDECDANATVSASKRSCTSVVECHMNPPGVIDSWKSIGLSEQSDELLGSLSETFTWDCPDSPPDKVLVPSLPLKRKLSSAEVSNKRARDNTGSEAVTLNAFSRGMATPSISSGPSRRDTFRQRKPNTSRPPSMHVDDYVARERNVDGISGSSNVMGSSQRGGSTSGRPPSIHVDEFMARQRERQVSTAAAVGDSLQVANPPIENDSTLEKADNSRKLKADLDDDHEIDIVFDEESESEDPLPFPQLDDSLTNPLVTGESPPDSIIEESESDLNGGSPSDFRSRASVAQSENTPAKEASSSLGKSHLMVNAAKAFFQEKSDDSKCSSHLNDSKRMASKLQNSSANCPPNLFVTSLPMPAQQTSDARPSFPAENPQKVLSSMSAISFGFHEQKIPANHPPPPPMPPLNVSSLHTRIVEPAQNLPTHFAQTARDVKLPLPSGYPQQSYDAINSTTASIHGQAEAIMETPSQSMMDPKFSRGAVLASNQMNDQYASGSLIRPAPPLPPLPPPFTSSSMAQSLAASSVSQSSLPSTLSHFPSSNFNEARVGLVSTGTPSFTHAPFTSLILARPSSSPGALLGSPTQQGQNTSGPSAPLLSPLTSLQPIQARVLPPPPPPQLPRPPHLSQQIRPPPQVQQAQQEHVSLPRNPIQLQLQQLQLPQQLQTPQIQFYYQTQPDNIPQIAQTLSEQSQPPNLHIQPDITSQQEQDAGMTLQQYFSSPEAIQSLLGDREKLCQILEQHPKLMQMLQERLGQ